MYIFKPSHKKVNNVNYQVVAKKGLNFSMIFQYFTLVEMKVRCLPGTTGAALEFCTSVL